MSFAVCQHCRSQRIRNKAEKKEDSDGNTSPQKKTETDKDNSKSKYFVNVT